MGEVIIRCPQTGHPIPTGYEADPARFRQMPVFFAISYCPICRADHQWFAGDAWVREQAAAAKPARDTERPAPVWLGARKLAPGSEKARTTRPQRGTP